MRNVRSKKDKDTDRGDTDRKEKVKDTHRKEGALSSFLFSSFN